MDHRGLGTLTLVWWLVYLFMFVSFSDVLKKIELDRKQKCVVPSRSQVRGANDCFGFPYLFTDLKHSFC